jgi:lipid-A-disaccharide synthase
MPKLAIMPGSRPAEMENCFPILLDAFRRLKRDFPQTTAVVAATRPEAAERLRAIAAEQGRGDGGAGGTDGGEGAWPTDMSVVCGDTDSVIRWCDFALVVSGTVTLQIAKQRKPMVAVYRPNKLMYHTLGRWLVSTDVFTLPNLIAGRRVIPEFIPHWGDGEDLAVEVIKFMRRTGYADDQRQALDAVCRRFEGMQAAPNAADVIERMLGLVGSSGPATPAPALAERSTSPVPAAV